MIFLLEGKQRLGQIINIYFRLWLLGDNYNDFKDKKIQLSTLSHDTSNDGNYSNTSYSKSLLYRSKINASMSRLFKLS